MKFSQLPALAFAATALAAPSTTTQKRATGCSSAVKLDASTNVWKKYTLHANSFYRGEIEAALSSMDESTAEKAKEVAQVGSFLWLDTIENINKLQPVLDDGVPCDHILGLVIYDLPGRDCAAKASNGELKVGELSKYKTQYIDGKRAHNSGR